MIPEGKDGTISKSNNNVETPVKGLKTNTVAPLNTNSKNILPSDQNVPISAATTPLKEKERDSMSRRISTKDMEKAANSREAEKVPVNVPGKAPQKGSEKPAREEKVKVSNKETNKEEKKESHDTHESGLLSRDAKNIVNPNNMIAAVKRGDLKAVREIAKEMDGNTQNGINAVGACVPVCVYCVNTVFMCMCSLSVYSVWMCVWMCVSVCPCAYVCVGVDVSVVTCL